MSVRDLLPWGKRERTPARKEESTRDPFFAFRREMDRLFDDFWGDSLPAHWSGQPDFPRVDVSETAKDIVVSAELPGLDEKEVNVSVERDALVISGEKRSERESNEENVHRLERSYGAFRRVVPLPVEVDQDRAEAEYRRGILTVRLPKRAEAEQSRRRITVKSA